VGERWIEEGQVVAAMGGDRDALEMVLQGAHPHVQRFARFLCSSPEDAEDAAQEALFILYRKIGSLRASAALAGWVMQIVRNECMRRARSLHQRYDLLNTVDVRSAEDEVLAKLEAARVTTAIAELPDSQRRALIMRDILGYPGRMVADTLGLSLPAMKSQLHRARVSLHAKLEGGEHRPPS
jgi:RNA polymerase sigma factor (sigma-70 family)